MMQKYAEDDRIEQMNAQKRRMKQLEHQRAIEKILEQRRQQFIAQQVCSFCLPVHNKLKSTGPELIV